jgi:hypothetical protein
LLLDQYRLNFTNFFNFLTPKKKLTGRFAWSAFLGAKFSCCKVATHFEELKMKNEKLRMNNA